MPCYLFTYHTYGTWLPDRKQGYVKRGRGVLPTDRHMHRLYVEAMTETIVELDGDLQQATIASLLESEPHQKFELYYVATEATHVHVVLGWRDERDPVKMRSLVKGSMTRFLNRVRGRRTWLAEGGSRSQVRSRRHFEHLVTIYLPRHGGWKWSREMGVHL